MCGECAVSFQPYSSAHKQATQTTSTDLSINLLIDLCISVVTSFKPGVQMWQPFT